MSLWSDKRHVVGALGERGGLADGSEVSILATFCCVAIRIAAVQPSMFEIYAI